MMPIMRSRPSSTFDNRLDHVIALHLPSYTPHGDEACYSVNEKQTLRRLVTTQGWGPLQGNRRYFTDGGITRPSQLIIDDRKVSSCCLW